MIKSIKHIALVALLFPLLLTGCTDLFDKGDTEQAYNGPDVVAFGDLQSTVTEGGSRSIDIQLISSRGVAASDVNVSISVDNDASSAPASTYSLSSNAVTISSGTTAATLTVDFPTNGDISDGDEVRLVLTLSSNDVEVAENLGSTTIFINGAG